MANILKVLKGPLSTLGKKNRNGRIYSKELWENVLKSEYWKDMMDNNSLCGEIVHPGERTESDSWEIDARNISHRIKEAHIEGDKLMGTVEVLDTEQGRNLAELINAGITIGISARGMGDLVGDEVDPDTYNFKTFDITMRPSDPNARLVPIMESEGKRIVILESEESDRLIKGAEEPVDAVEDDKLNRNSLAQIVATLVKNGLTNIKNGDKVEIEIQPNGLRLLYNGSFIGAIVTNIPEESDTDCLVVSGIGTDVDSVRIPTSVNPNDLINGKDPSLAGFLSQVLTNILYKIKDNDKGSM